MKNYKSEKFEVNGYNSKYGNDEWNKCQGNF